VNTGFLELTQEITNFRSRHRFAKQVPDDCQMTAFDRPGEEGCASTDRSVEQGQQALLIRRAPWIEAFSIFPKKIVQLSRFGRRIDPHAVKIRDKSIDFRWSVEKLSEHFEEFAHVDRYWFPLNLAYCGSLIEIDAIPRHRLPLEFTTSAKVRTS
jgi:hypothetical protein